MGTLITPIYTPFCIRSPEGNPPFFCGEDFLGFFLELFPGAITTAAAITITIITAITPATFIIITTAAATTAIGNTPTKIKALPFRETF